MKCFLDTNAVIDLFKGDISISQKIANSDEVQISVITVMEFLSFCELSSKDKNLFREFSREIIVSDILNHDIELIEKIAFLRIKYRVKIPDAIILAQSIISGSNLITSDAELNKIKKLELDQIKGDNNE